LAASQNKMLARFISRYVEKFQIRSIAPVGAFP
jgi:hypothetical protein